MEFFSTLPDFGEGGGPGVCEVLGLVSCFCCNGVALSTEEILPNFGEGGRPRVWLLAFVSMD